MVGRSPLPLLILLWPPCQASSEAPRKRDRRKRRRGQHQMYHQDGPMDGPSRSLKEECTSKQQPFVLNFQTDSYGSETSWFLRLDDGTSQQYVDYGPRESQTYGDFTLYSFSHCLDIGKTYTLAVEDNFGDGMCCSRGYGGYEYKLGGVRLYTSDLRPTFREYAEHTFVVDSQYSLAASETLEPGSDVLCQSQPGECGCEDVLQTDYRGDLAQTESGYTCQPWAETASTSDAYPESGLVQNYCRNPDQSPGGTWCYTDPDDSDVEWEYCRVPTCGVVADADLVPKTAQPNAEPTEARPATHTGSSGEGLVNGPTLLPSATPTKQPTVNPTSRPTSRPTSDYSVLNESNGCYGGDVRVTVEVRADEYSTDTSWEFIHPNGTKIMGENPSSFLKHEYKRKEMCVPHGEYTFIVYDVYGDGMCCRYGEGFFKIHLDGKQVLNGGSFNDNVTATVNIGYEPDGYMTERERQYLDAHNVRRKEWHERYNLTYVPLSYSPGIARTAKAWADELLWSCAIVGIEHESSNPYGENLAKNTGNSETWGQLYHPDLIVGRWVDKEIGLPYPSNGHLTQALWRASMYLGCGESTKKFRNGVCRVQVCRYSRAGNCDMKRFNSTEGENWLVPMLDNYTRW
ncbi:hypothetical protein THAOC_14153 [Thalassiosira oceanica]|uniref:Kringle domain-containing protein n=1 Tax=Thalassiosira oceanica TaxID=159749 RepID=K0SI47_THAOC|nr:hypothetical protein THAOC_14153 [Thalassiosira oceanica]|eukprot:EJK65050.1 hypothetical protein THAOC_14153 [Thalassiosira oceanica]